MSSPTIRVLAASFVLLLPARPAPADASSGTLSPVSPGKTIHHRLTVDPDDLLLAPGSGGDLRVSLPGLFASGRPGAPALPGRTVHLALPPGTLSASVTGRMIDVVPPMRVPLGGGRVASVPHPRLLCPWICDRPIEVPAALPQSSGGHPLEVGRLGPVVVASFAHRPVELDASGGSLLVHPHQLLEVSFRTRPDAPVAATLRPGGVPARLAPRLVDNPGALGRWYPVRRDSGDSGLAVITTESFASASEALADYMAVQEQRGLAPVLVTEADYDAVTGPVPDERPQRIRTWLQQHADELQLGYALLIGNPDPYHGDIPMLPARPFSPDGWEFCEETPTDAYYADLSGDWDLDGDGLYAEYKHDRGPGGVDFLAELHVGRIPVYGDVEAADRLLQRAADYAVDRSDTGWRRRALFPGAILFFRDRHEFGSEHMEGGDVAEVMRPRFEEKDFEVVTLYERAGLKPSVHDGDLPLTEEDFISAWDEGHGLIYWFGHGSEDAAYRTVWAEDPDGDANPSMWELASTPFMQSIMFERLPHDRPALVFHGSCSNGTPENAANIAYTQLKSGAIAAYASTRVATGSTGFDWEPSLDQADIFQVGYFVTSKLRDGASTGAALGETLASMSDAYYEGFGWHTKLGVVLYGDPTLTLTNCAADTDCDDGLPCTGEESCRAGICHAGIPPDCSGLDDPCNRGVCDDQTGSCLAVPLDGQSCDDGHFCTVGDRCRDGVCGGTPRTCEARAGPCIQGVCDEEALSCRAERLPDGQDCTLDGARGTCRAGVCKPDQGCGCGRPVSCVQLCLLLFLILVSRRTRRTGASRLVRRP